MLCRNVERSAVAGGEQLVLALVATVPYWANSVYDFFARQVVAFRYFALPCGATAQGAAFS